jgi:hypothetical protein
MLSEQDILKMVINKFPEQANRLTELFYKDENFREICEDYVLCIRSMDKIISTTSMTNRILKEYKKALKELENEMLMYLDSGIATHEN